MPLPMPLVPPVTMTDLFLSDVSTGFPSFRQVRLRSEAYCWKASEPLRHVRLTRRKVMYQITHTGAQAAIISLVAHDGSPLGAVQAVSHAEPGVAVVMAAVCASQRRLMSRSLRLPF